VEQRPIIDSERLARNSETTTNPNAPTQCSLNEHTPLSDEKLDDPEVVWELFKDNVITAAQGSAGFASVKFFGIANKATKLSDFVQPRSERIWNGKQSNYWPGFDTRIPFGRTWRIRENVE
jgi:hypothetical protein